MGTDGLEHGQRFQVAVDVVLQLRAFVTDVFRIQEDGRYSGVDHGRFQGSDPRHVKVIHQVAGGEHGTFTIGRIHEFNFHFRRREGYAIQFEITGLLHFTIGDGYMGHDGFLDVGLPDAHRADTVFRNPLFGNKSAVDGEGTYRSGEVAAVTTPVHKRLVDRYLPEQVVHVVVRLRRCGQNHRFTGTGGGVTQAVDLLLVGIGTADHPKQQLIAGFAGHLTGFRQVLQAEKHTFTGTATHVGGWNLDLWRKTHGIASCEKTFFGHGIHGRTRKNERLKDFLPRNPLKNTNKDH